MTDKKKLYLKNYRAKPENKKKHAGHQRQYVLRKSGVLPIPRIKRSVEENKLIAKEKSRQRRLMILNHYGNGNPHCVCCGESHFQFLALDHINGGGSKHRKEVGNGTMLYAWIIRNNFPEMFQILCHNCNSAKGFYGQCPHKIHLGFQSNQN
jgi:hypothetical protein